jgi:hypothetical protein
MSANLRYLGLDVHTETIAVALAEPGGEVRSLGIIPNEPSAVAKLIRKLGGRQHLRACYEAGPCGYVLYWQLTKLGVAVTSSPRPLCRPNPAIASKPIGATPRSSRAAIALVT